MALAGHIKIRELHTPMLHVYQILYEPVELFPNHLVVRQADCYLHVLWMYELPSDKLAVPVRDVVLVVLEVPEHAGLQPLDVIAVKHDLAWARLEECYDLNVLVVLPKNLHRQLVPSLDGVDDDVEMASLLGVLLYLLLIGLHLLGGEGRWLGWRRRHRDVRH